MNLPELRGFCEEYLEEIENIQIHSEKTMNLNISLAKEIINTRLIANDTILNTK